MYCLLKTNPQINILVHEFGEVKVSTAANKYFPEGAPSTYQELYQIAKDDFGVLSKASAKKELSINLPTKISNQQLINLRKAVSEANNKAFSEDIPIVYKTVNTFRQGQADLFSWDILKLNKNLKIQEKIERLKQSLDSSKSQQSLRDLENLSKHPGGQGILFSLDSPQINYQLKVISIITKNIAKIRQWEKDIKNPPLIFEKIQKDLQIPKEQVKLLRNSPGETIEEKLVSFSATYSFSVESSVSRTTKATNDSEVSNPEFVTEYNRLRSEGVNSEVAEELAVKKIRKELEKNTDYYINITVPGGINYTENEISTPLITPFIKGHAAFSTDKGIGWFRSDEKAGSFYEDDGEIKIFPDSKPIKIEGGIRTTSKVDPSKTRRILEIQSDLFQKSRNFPELVGGGIADGIARQVTKEQEAKNDFLQLLNKDNNWVSFFVKSIIQDSAKKGYEKVLFPVGDTAAKVEGHATIEEFIKTREEVLANVNSNLLSLEGLKDDEYPKKGTYNRFINMDLVPNETVGVIRKDLNREKEQFERELKEAREGTLKMSSIHSFYENNVTNILKKQGYSPNVITDEYGNKWNEVQINHTRDTSTILFQGMGNNYQTLAKDRRTLEKLKDLMLSLNVDIQSSDVLKMYGINATVDLINRVITIAEGKEHVALTEEAMHMISTIVPQPIFEDLISKIKEYRIYKSTYNHYKNKPNYQNPDGSVNEHMMKMEAVGKLLAEYYIRNSEGLTDEEVNIAKTLWGKILDWIRNVFYLKKDAFADVIKELQQGTLPIYDHLNADTILFSLDFTKNDAEKLAKSLSLDITKEELKDPNLSSDPAIKTINELIKLTKKIDAQHLKMIGESVRHIKKMSNASFKTSNYKIEKFNKAKEIRDRIVASLEYIRSIDTNINVLSIRSQEARAAIKKGTEIDKETGETKTLTPLELKFLSQELSNINNVAAIYVDELNSYKKLFDEEEQLFGLDKAINQIDGRARDLLRLNDDAGVIYLKKLLTKAQEPKLKGYIKAKTQDLKFYQDRMKRAKDQKTKDYIQKKIDVIEALIKKPPFSADNIINSIKSTKQNFWGLIPHFMEGSLTHYDDAIQTVANGLLNEEEEAKKETAKTIPLINEAFSKLGPQPTFLRTHYDRFLEMVERKKFNKITGDLETRKEWRYVQDLNQWQFENDIAQLESDIFKSILADDEALEESLRAQLSYLYKTYGKTKYTEAYYEITDTLEVPLANPLADDIKTVRDVRQEYLDYLSSANEELDGAITPNDVFTALDKVDLALRDLQQLSSEYNIDGSKKKGDALLIATTLKKFKDLKREGKVDNWFMTNNKQAQWNEQKEEVDEEYNKAIESGDEDLIQEATDKMDAWYAVNTRSTVLLEYYEKKEDVSARIADLLEEIRPKDEAVTARLDELSDKLQEFTKGYRDQDGTLIGSDFSREQVANVKTLDVEIQRIRDEAREGSEKLSKEDKAELNKLFKELNALQSTLLTPFWEMTFQREQQQIIDELPVGFTPQDLHEAIQKSIFIRENTINVTDKYRHTTRTPKNIVKIGSQYYAPIYIWRKVQPKKKWIKRDQPSQRWMSYAVADEYVNPEYKTIEGNIALDPSKLSTLPNKYIGDKYKKLSDKDKEFLNSIVDIYYTQQKKKAKSERLGHALPRIQAERYSMQRIGQRIHNAKHLLPPEARTIEYWKEKTNNFLGLDTTTLETIYGEGALDDDEVEYEENSILKDRNRSKVRVANKYADKKFSVNKQDKDLYRLMLMYTIEADRSAKMKEIAPAMTSLRSVMASHAGRTVFGETKNNRTQRINYEIEKKINKRTSLDTGSLERGIGRWSTFTLGAIALQRIGMPYQISSTLKNTAQGAFQMWVNNGYLSSYSEGSITSAFARAFLRSIDVTLSQFRTKPSKYVAVMRRIHALNSLDINDTTTNFKSHTLKVADNLKYWLGSQRHLSEIHQEITLFELLRSKKIRLQDEDGNVIEKDILDMYDYENYELKPKKGMTLDIENSFRDNINEMHNFTQGNFSPDNAILLKAFWWGKILGFMKGFIYNPAIRRFGGSRVLVSGQEIRGIYRTLWDIIRTHPLDIIHSQDLTPAEKAGLYGFMKDFMVVNGIGILMRGLEAVAESGGLGDDDDEWYNWYGLLMLRKLYAELGYFNLLDTVGTGFNFLFSNDTKIYSRGNAIDNLFTYALERPLGDMVKSGFLPFDNRGLKYKWDIKGKVKDPYYAQFDDNVLLFDFLRALKTKPDPYYSKSALSYFKYYNQSIYDYEKPKGKHNSLGE